MTVPSTLIHASRDFERFLLDAREELGLGPTHRSYAAVLAVLVTSGGKAIRGDPSPGWERGRGEGLPPIAEPQRRRRAFC